MKLLKTSDELISHMKTKGIKFNIVKEEDAKIFLQNNTVVIGEDLHRILYVDVHHLAKLNGKNDSSKLVYLTYHTG